MFATILSAILLSVGGTAKPDTTLCMNAANFLRDDRHMIATIDTDTVDDWRTGKKTPGCRVTAAGGSTQTVPKEAVFFYDRVRALGWARTPDPRDAPTEASLRFRRDNADCLFNVNASALLNTDSEQRVNDALKLNERETRYQVFVMCVPAAAAKPRQ
ncbi:MAG: hypothetical protein ABJB66_17015 [Gemmatimonadaceae bacterium]